MKIYNTLSGRKEDFIPQSDTVNMYVCGVTPYAPSHLGHAMSYIVFDTIRRYLEFRGYKVKYVQNFTDIDDKIIARANESGISPHDLAQGFIEQYFANMDALNIKRADIYPRATEEIPKMIEVIEGLIQKGHAYEVGGDVYFRVQSDPDYGKLSHRTLDGMMAGARVEIGENKEHPLDFALWKAAKPGEPQWHSPWGPGRPGWHIECTAMSLRYLGQTLDIHGGGQDLIFPHHENEIAQSESFTGIKPFVRHWLHNGLLQLGEEKMSKSTGKLVTISEALAKYSPDALRLWVISSHYRSPITYSDENLTATEKGVERLRNTNNLDIKESAAITVESQTYKERFIEAMDDDFGTPQAIAALFDLAREINRGNDEVLHIGEALETLRELASILGLTLAEVEERHRVDVNIEAPTAPASSEAMVPEIITSNGVDIDRVNSLIKKREEFRRAKEWHRADQIRNDLKELGVALEDTPQGTVWRYKKP
jgi:cysteinyl-tRNA synthetase